MRCSSPRRTAIGKGKHARYPAECRPPYCYCLSRRRGVVGVAIGHGRGLQAGRFDNSYSPSKPELAGGSAGKVIERTHSRYAPTVTASGPNPKTAETSHRGRKSEGPMSSASPITSHALLRAPPSQGRPSATRWIGLRLGSHESNSQLVTHSPQSTAGAPVCLGQLPLCAVRA